MTLSGCVSRTIPFTNEDLASLIEYPFTVQEDTNFVPLYHPSRAIRSLLPPAPAALHAGINYEKRKMRAPALYLRYT